MLTEENAGSWALENISGVAISSVCGTEQLQQAEGASHMMWTLVECN